MMLEHTSVTKKAWFSSTRFLRPAVILPGLAIFMVVGGGALIWLPQFLLDNWLANQSVDASTVRLAVGNAAQVVLFSLGGIIALVGVSLSLSRHRLELEDSRHDRMKEDRRVVELDQQRSVDAERELRTRFTQAIALLSDPDKPTTRQAGVYALGALADDWTNHGRPDERQVCIDVICGYLRSHWDPQSNGADDERRIRATAFNLIASHHSPKADRPSWDGADFNFRDATVDFDIDFRSVTVNASRIDFTDATFSGGTAQFTEAIFSGGTVLFTNATFSGGALIFIGAKFSGGDVSFNDVQFSGCAVQFDHATFSRGTVWFFGATFSNGDVRFYRTKFSGGLVLFSDAVFSGGDVRFTDATFSGGIVQFDRARFSGGTVGFTDATFSGGDVLFDYARFSGTTVRFDRATFSGGIVLFDNAGFLGGEMLFNEAQFLSGFVRFTGVTFSSGEILFNGAKLVGGNIVVEERVFTEFPVVIPWHLSNAN